MSAPMVVPSQDPSDTEAFLESADREVTAAHGGGIVQSRRALGLAACALGLVACAAVLRGRRELRDTTSAHLEGFAMMESVASSQFRIGVFKSPSEAMTKCWEVGGYGGNDLVEADCDGDSPKQAFELRDHHAIVNDGKCLSTDDEGLRLSFVECDDEDEKQMFQLPQRGPNFGTIHNCRCTSEANCKKSCDNAPAISVSSSRDLIVGQGSTTFQWVAVTDKCSVDGDNCETSRCCEHPQSRCYKKNDHWGSCNHTCSSKMKWVEDAWQEQEEPVWDCGVLSCTANGEDCSTSKCCSEPGMKCFIKNDHWSSCNQTCSPKMKWVEDAWQEQEEPVWDCDVLSH